MPVSLSIQCIAIDSADPDDLATFWQEALGWRCTHDTPDEVALDPPEGSLWDGVAPDLMFLRVPDEKVARTGCISICAATTRPPRSPGSAAESDRS